ELTGLADYYRPGSDQEDLPKVFATGHLERADYQLRVPGATIARQYSAYGGESRAVKRLKSAWPRKPRGSSRTARPGSA
ncbi:MAG: hypothetical protein JWN04_5433, partial [Myxococcaceae bacterium]|nr:hypothetical protein [Myxococcaceae bacterium]